LDSQTAPEIPYYFYGRAFETFPYLQKNSSIFALDGHEEDHHRICPRMCCVPVEQVPNVFTTRATSAFA